MFFQPIIPESAWPYLFVQKGSLDYLKGDREAWYSAYCEHTRAIYDEIRPWLPNRCREVLDVGSGLGGIDILIADHYAYLRKPQITLLDGLDDAPKVTKHRKTFNNMEVAAAFHIANGALLLAHYDANNMGQYTDTDTRFDLVVSFGAWCFHIPPSEYLDFVAARMNPGARLIVDLRIGKPEWAEEIAGPFKPLGFAGQDGARIRDDGKDPKFVRAVYERR